MEIADRRIDGGKPFDWGRTSEDYAKYRDIYPPEFYRRILDRGLCRDGQRVLDLGTGTGVLPRNLYAYGARWTGVDISEEQIRQARLLSEDMDIRYLAASAEELDFPDRSFDVVTACQCFSGLSRPRNWPTVGRSWRTICTAEGWRCGASLCIPDGPSFLSEARVHRSFPYPRF